VSRSRELLATVMGAQAGGFLAQPPGLDGDPGLGIPGISGVPRGRSWEASASAHAPEIKGDTVTFVTLTEGTVIVDDDQPDGSLVPLADAIEVTLPPPYRAAAVRNEGDVWSVVAERVVIVELPEIDGDVIDLSTVDGVRELRIDDVVTIRPLPALDVLTEEHRDVALHAERIDGETFAVDVFPL
jgi:hypothetical protein